MTPEQIETCVALLIERPLEWLLERQTILRQQQALWAHSPSASANLRNQEQILDAAIKRKTEGSIG